MGPPAKFLDTPVIQKLAWRSVRFRGISNNLPIETDNSAYQSGELENCELDTRSYIDMACVGVNLHQVNASVGAVINIQKFAAGRASTPYGQLPCPIDLAIVRLPNKCGNDVTGIKVEPVARAVQVRGHRRNKVRAELPTISLTELDTCNLGDSIPF